MKVVEELDKLRAEMARKDMKIAHLKWMNHYVKKLATEIKLDPKPLQKEDHTNLIKQVEKLIKVISRTEG